jgi:hypothetical protein
VSHTYLVPGFADSGVSLVAGVGDTRENNHVSFSQLSTKHQVDDLVVFSV